MFEWLKIFFGIAAVVYACCWLLNHVPRWIAWQRDMRRWRNERKQINR
jgi:hypothetical protein